ncbi:MAG TPA: hypothetical protein VED41_11595, partial [Solirubrobacteraceae bacterium]|nr:hypothetical protein [Solirubrobacteraceae bacterium]
PLAMTLELDAPLSVEACVDALRAGRARAMIGRLPAAPLTHGILAGAARAVEDMRRPVWRAGRKLLRERRGLSR